MSSQVSTRSIMTRCMPTDNRSQTKQVVMDAIAWVYIALLWIHIEFSGVSGGCNWVCFYKSS